MPDRAEMLWDTPRLDAPHAQPDKAGRVRGMFDAIAPTYELVNSLASLGRDAFWRRRMVELARVRAEDVLLDIACGTGDVTRAFAAGNRDGIRPAGIIGLDFAWSMLERAASRPVAHARFCQADALHLPLADSSVSIVSCAFGIRNFQDLDAGLREMHRVLRPGGRAVILEFSVPTGRLMRAMYLFYLRHVLPALGTLISRDHTGAYRYLPSSVLSFVGRDAIVTALRRANFSRVTVHPLTLGIVAVYVGSRDGAASE